MGVGMHFRVVALALAVSLTGIAQMRMSVEQLLSFLRSSIQLKQDDRQVADYVKKIKLSNRLEERPIEELQGQGLGPNTVQALHDLSGATVSLPTAMPPAPKPTVPPIPPPRADEQ